MPRIVAVTGAHDAFQRMFLSAQQVNALAASILSARRAFLVAGDTVTARRVAEIYKTFNDSLNKVAEETARKGESAARRALDSTRVRPNSNRGPLKLRDQIRSEYAKGSPSLAYVGVGIIEELDKAVNPFSSSRDPYWRVQEFGFAYSHVPKGFFFGAGFQGASAPNPASFRAHPLFVPSSKGRKFLQPPTLDARHFMRDGSAVAAAFWTAGVEAASRTAASEMQQLVRLRRAP